MPRSRTYAAHDDIGLNPEADRTEDLRPTKNAPGRCANTAEGLEPPNNPFERKSFTMKPHDADNPYPVDSTYHACCHAIGGHAPTCSTTEPDRPLPTGATTDGWTSVDPDGTLVRSLVWSTHDAIGVGIGVDGWQTAKGLVSRGISMYGTEGQSWDAMEAMKVAAGLMNAAVALMQLDQSDPLPSSPVELLANAFAAVRAAHGALEMEPGNAGDYVRAALDSISDAAEVLR